MSSSHSQRIYLDHNGSTPVTPEVVREIQAFIEGFWGNAGAGHPDGAAARAAIELAAQRVARAIGGRSEEITFTSGGTESNNAALIGVAEAELAKGGAQRRHLVAGRHEHLSVVRTIEMLERRGFEVTWINPGRSGAVESSTLRSALRPDTLLCSLMFANNETGILQPVRAAADLCHGVGALLFVDAVCGAGKVPIDVAALDCDLLSVSGHKLHAPKGVGALWARAGVEIAPLIHGCGQQDGRRSGTENTMGAVALGAAMEAHAKADKIHSAGIRSLRDRLLAAIIGLGVGAERNGEGPDLPNTLSVWFPGHDALKLQVALGERGVSVSSQAAKPHSEEVGGPSRPSHVLLSMGLGAERASESLRFSVGSTTSSDEIDAAIGALEATFVPSS